MAKLTRKEKIELQRTNTSKIQKKRENKFINSITVKNIFKKNWWFMLALILLCVGVYFNSLDNELTLVDDHQGIVQNETIPDLKKSLKSFHLQTIVYAISYRFFEYNPLPIRIVSVFLHVVITLLSFLIIYLLYDRKTAIISSLVFAVHPINTEAVTWVSGAPYLYITISTFFTMLFFLLFRKYNDSKLFLALTGISFILMIITQKSPWVLMVPIVLVIIDQLFLNDKIDTSKLWWLIIFAIPIAFYLLTIFNTAFRGRIHIREDGGSHGQRITLHTQALKPVTQGYPYTTYTMVKLYLYPMNLSVYYDGMQVTTGLLVMMNLTFIVYVGLVIYLWNKNRRITGVLLLFPFLIAPAYSPIKITWFLAERYLYAGTLFFGVLIAYLFKFAEKKIRPKFIVYGIFGVLLVLYSIRTILRNNDWQNTETLSFANMKASPLSVRPYNDIGGHYYFIKDIDKAVEYYEKGLTVVPNSGTAINNLGLIYLEYSPLIFRKDFVQPERNEVAAQKYFAYAVKLNREGGEIFTISYFMNKALALDINSVELNIAAADMYYRLYLLDDARLLYERVLELDPGNEHAINVIEIIDSGTIQIPRE